MANDAFRNVMANDTFRKAMAVTVGAKAPDFTLPGSDGKTWKLSELKGRTVVLNVGSGDASILRTSADHTTVVRLPVGHDQNTIAIAPDGKHAVVIACAVDAQPFVAETDDARQLQAAAAGHVHVHQDDVGFQR